MQDRQEGQGRQGKRGEQGEQDRQAGKAGQDPKGRRKILIVDDDPVHPASPLSLAPYIIENRLWKISVGCYRRLR